MKLKKKEYLQEFLIPISLAIILYCTGDVLLKKGNIEIESSFSDLFQGGVWVDFFLHHLIITALILSLLAKIVMGYILSKNQLGFSQGFFLGISAIILFLIGVLIFNETFTLWKAAAICIISIGIFLLHSNERSINTNRLSKIKNLD